MSQVSRFDQVVGVDRVAGSHQVDMSCRGVLAQVGDSGAQHIRHGWAGGVAFARVDEHNQLGFGMAGERRGLSVEKRGMAIPSRSATAIIISPGLASQVRPSISMLILSVIVRSLTPGGPLTRGNGRGRCDTRIRGGSA